MGETNRNCFVFSLLVIRSRRKTATGNDRAAIPPHISYAGTPTMSFQHSCCCHFPSTPDLPYSSVGSSCASIPVPPSQPRVTPVPAQGVQAGVLASPWLQQHRLLPAWCPQGTGTGTGRGHLTSSSTVRQPEHTENELAFVTAAAELCFCV